jgi:cytochrome bd-type quinol oxidase subunit 2
MWSTMIAGLISIAAGHLAGDEDGRSGRTPLARPSEMAVAGGTRFHGGGKSVDAVAEPHIAARWFSLPNFYFLWPVPVVTALTALAAWH